MDGLASRVCNKPMVYTGLSKEFKDKLGRLLFPVRCVFVCVCVCVRVCACGCMPMCLYTCVLGLVCVGG